MAGSTIVTADTQVVATGKPVRVYTMHVISGGTAAVVSLKSGGSGGTVWVTATGAISTGVTTYFGSQGLVLPSGLYVDVDTNTTSVALTYSVETA